MDLQRYLCRAVGEWSRLGKLTRPLVKALCTHAEHDDHLKVINKDGGVMGGGRKSVFFLLFEPNIQ